MSNIIQTGLCALLIGINSPTASYTTLEKSLDNNPTELITQQKLFIGPDGYYSLNCNPKDFGYSLTGHEKDTGPSYDDIYVSSMGQINISCTTTNQDLETLFDTFIGEYMKNISDGLSAGFKPGEGVRIVGKGQPKKLFVDGNPALQGGAEWWMSSGDILKEKYGEKYDFVMTLARGKKNMYVFILYYLKDDTIKEAQTNAFYNEILKSFHALK